VDGTFTTATLCGAARLSFPFSGDVASYIVEQDFMVFFANFSAAALDSTHGTHTTAYLVGESALQDIGGGIARFTRTWAKIPATRTEYESFAYTFPGYYPGPGTVDGRANMTRTVVSRLVHEYFLCATGQTYTTPSAIPIISAQRYTLAGDNTAEVQWLVDATAYPFAAYTTDPTLPDYKALVSGQDEIVAEDSRLTRWMGNIYERVTRYVIAQ
jgi:hypothetical protein